MKDYIDIQERPSWGRMLPLSFQHLFAMFGSTVLVPYLLKVDPATALFMNGIGTLLYLFVCKGKIPAYLGSSFAFIAPVAGVLSAGLGYEAAKGAFVGNRGLMKLSTNMTLTSFCLAKKSLKASGVNYLNILSTHYIWN